MNMLLQMNRLLLTVMPTKPDFLKHTDEEKAACDFWVKWPCIVEQDLKTHPQIKLH